MASLPTLSDGITLTHFIVAEDVERASRFYSDVLGGEIVLAGQPTIVALANSWIIINVGGGPTDDKPSVILGEREAPRNAAPDVAVMSAVAGEQDQLVLVEDRADQRDVG